MVYAEMLNIMLIVANLGLIAYSFSKKWALIGHVSLTSFAILQVYTLSVYVICVTSDRPEVIVSSDLICRDPAGVVERMIIPLNYKDRSKNMLESRRCHTQSFVVYTCSIAPYSLMNSCRTRYDNIQRFWGKL